MNTALWILQAFLALVFLVSGGIKLLGTRETMKRMGWAYIEDFTDTQLKLVGVAELLGAIGVILPAATDIAPVLTPIAATGLALLLAGALVMHLRRKEYSQVIFPTIVLVLAAIVAWGRFGP